MQSFKFLLSRICKTVSTMDLRYDVHEERARDIATKARRFESKNKTAGKLSVYKVNDYASA